ncbi:MAG: histidine phosphatase family protein [Aerococcaceae bacterium]|nr:histidine phosphatase family protein [Aerococcaceae bacterium]
MTRQILYFLRHGQTQFNVFGRLQGWSNSQLTPKGIAVAKHAGKAFQQIPFDAVYSSDLTRALDTASLFLEAANQALPVHPSADLREIGFGYFEGLDGRNTWKLADVRAADLGLIPEGTAAPEAIRIDMLHQMDPYHLAENYHTFATRLKNGIQTILAENTDKQHLLIVSHSSSIKAIFDTFDPNYQTTENADNGSMSILHYENGQFVVQGFNLFEL